MSEKHCLYKIIHGFIFIIITALAPRYSSLILKDWMVDHQMQKLSNYEMLPDPQYLEEKDAQMYPHKCHLCSKTFTQNGSLNRNMITHNNERPFACDACPKHFKYKSVLTSHKKLHMKDSFLRCKTCGTGYRRVSSLQAHELVCEKEMQLYNLVE